jgi:hypothetical protein
MTDYYEIEAVAPAPQFGNSGPEGWGFTLGSERSHDEAPYRALLERLADVHPQAALSLPEWEEGEDLIEGWLVWKGEYVWVWFETLLSHLWLWSFDRATIESLRTAILPLAE